MGDLKLCSSDLPPTHVRHVSRAACKEWNPSGKAGSFTLNELYLLNFLLLS